jgi:hypothetical protein
MYIGEISDFDDDRLKFNCESIRWQGRELELLDAELNGARFAKTILASFDGLSSARIRPMGSVGGSVSAEKDKEGNSEITAEVHVTSRSDDGNTSVKASGEGTIDHAGNYSGKVEVRVDHEF